MGNDNIDTSNAHKTMPLTPEQRVRKQAKFLAVYRECGNVKYSCKKAGISRTTFYSWRDTDEPFQVQLVEAQEDAHDTLEQAAYERAVLGVEEPVVSQGNLVYEYEPLLDKDGNQRYDDSTGKPMYKRGSQVVKRVYSDSLLTTLLKANLPTKYREKQQIDMTTTSTNDVEIQALHTAIEQALAGFPEAKIALAEAIVTMEQARDK